MHGITMIFLYASPVLSGFSNYLFPLVLGARDMAFPRLNAFSYWVYLAAGLFIYSSLLAAAAPNDGWFNYVPYALREYNPGPNLDFYALGMIFLGISTTVGSANFVVTFLRMRAPGMSLNLVPILTWGTTTVSVGNLLAVPSVSLAFFLLWTDRQFGTHFFRPNSGGHPLLWQHLFWMFAHPWVYVVVLPAMGLVSDSLPFFCRRPMVGYTAVVLGTVTTMALGFGDAADHFVSSEQRNRLRLHLQRPRAGGAQAGCLHRLCPRSQHRDTGVYLRRQGNAQQGRRDEADQLLRASRPAGAVLQHPGVQPGEARGAEAADAGDPGATTEARRPQDRGDRHHLVGGQLRPGEQTLQGMASDLKFTLPGTRWRPCRT